MLLLSMLLLLADGFDMLPFTVLSVTSREFV
jgi:hypothetical protein